MDDTYIIKKEYGAGSRNRTRNPKVMSLASWPNCSSPHAYLSGKEEVLEEPEARGVWAVFFLGENYHPIRISFSLFGS